VLDQTGRPVICEAAGKALDQPQLTIGGAEKHRTGLRGHPAKPRTLAAFRGWLGT
jgi:hypothetical protein